MRMARIMFALLLIGAASVGGLTFTSDMLAKTAEEQDGGAARGEEPVTVQVEPVESLTFAETVVAVGTTLARESVSLHPSASGRVVEIGFSAGDRVEEGDVLLRLEDQAARSALASAEATLAEMQAAFDRQQQLEQSGSSSEAALQSARAALLRAEAERDLAAHELDNRVLRAPFGGVVSFTGLARGQLVDSSTLVTTLDDLSLIEVAFSVPERYMARLEKGQAVKLVSPAYPDRSFTGTIAAVDTRVDQATRSIALRAEVPNDDNLLTAGMFMQGELVLEERSAKAVPEQALTASGTQSFIHVVQDGTVQRVEVTTGGTRDGMIEVAGDLPDDAQVIVTNLQSISDGAEVEVAPARQVQLDMAAAQ